MERTNINWRHVYRPFRQHYHSILSIQIDTMLSQIYLSVVFCCKCLYKVGNINMEEYDQNKIIYFLINILHLLIVHFICSK